MSAAFNPLLSFPVAEKIEMYPAELGIRARVDHPVLYNGLLVVPRVARRGWLRGCGRTTQRLRSQSRPQLVVDTTILRDSQHKMGITSDYIYIHTRVRIH